MERAVYQRLDKLEQQHWWFAARRKIIETMIGHFCGRGADKRILEAGCGTGGNLQMLSGFGDLAAFELDDEARILAGAKSKTEIKPGRLPDGIPFAPGQFDVVGAFDVLEHVEQDVESMSKLAEQLAPGGKLFITVPAMPWLWSRHDEIHHHYRRYTRASLDAALKRAGLIPHYISYFNMFLFPAIAGFRLLRKALRLPEAADDEMPAAGVNKILRAVFGAERFLLGRVSLPVGVSLLAVVGKS
jgi:SAM-dependent methyltransferase